MNSSLRDRINSKIRIVPNFPRHGILFKDVTPLIADSDLLLDMCQAMIPKVRIDKVAGIESRGFIFGSIIASMLNVGFIPIRKKGKLPPPTISQEYKLEYGESCLEISTGILNPNENVLVVDDIIATGGSANAAIQLISQLGSNVVGVSVLIEIQNLGGREALSRIPLWNVL
jgi:adenine phosphoribosyltransferase